MTAADIKGMDGSESPVTFGIVAKALRECGLPSEWIDVMVRCLISVTEHYLSVDGVLLYGSFGLMSGLWITTFVNTLLNALMHEMALVLSGDPVPRPLAGFVGDDSLFSGQFTVFTPAHIAKVGRAMGFAVTGDDKKPLGTSFMNPDDLRFLKRSLALARSGARAGLPCCTLPRSTIVGMLYMAEGTFTWARYASTLQNAWKELLMFEPDEELELKEHVRKAAALCSERGVVVALMSREEFESRLVAGSFSTWDSE